MEIDFIILIMLLVFYVFSQLSGKKKTQQRKGPAPEQGQSKRPTGQSSPELDDALREIREALGWPSSPESEPEPEDAEPVTVTPSPTVESTRETTSERHDRPSRPASTPSRPDARSTQRHQADTQTSAFSDFTGVDAPTAKKSRLDLPPPLSPSEEAGNKTHPLLRTLRSREGAQKAVIMAEIFEPRWRRLKS